MASNWTEHSNPEGRTYWFNSVTRLSVWEKPDDLKSPFERALSETKWKEYFSSGRKYYYNETKESKWTMPDELVALQDKLEKEGKADEDAANAVALTTTGSAAATDPSKTNGNNLQVGAHTGGPASVTAALPLRPNMPDDPVVPHNGFATFEEGEKAFMHLLRKANVQPAWTWEQTMRAIITDPLYRALNNTADKKATFEKYTAGLIAKEQEEREARLAKLRPAIRNMLKGNPHVFPYTTFPTADKLFAQHPIWQQARNETERKLIFEEYVSELRQREVQETRAARSRAIDKLMHLFQMLQVDVLTRWRTAYNHVIDSDEWNADPEMRKLPTLDILLAFEDYSRVREREFEEQTRKAQVEKTRKERKAREGFKEVLKELVDSGKIKARSKWKEVYPLFKEDPRYLDMLGNPGSNQLELFWDVVDGLDQKLDVKIQIVEEAISEYNAKQKPLQADGDVDMDSTSTGFSVGPETTEAEYRDVLKQCSSEKLDELTEEEVRLVYMTMRDAALKKQADEKRRAERKLRHQQEDLRYALRKLPEPLDLSMSYEDAVPLIEHLPEYKAIEDVDARRSAFSKFVKRQKERLRETAGSEDGGSTSGRKRKEPSRDHRDEHDREKGERDTHKEDRERERRSSKHYSRHDDYEHGYSRSRDYRDRGDREDKERDRDRDRDYRSSRHYRDEKDDRKRDRERERRSDYGHEGRRDWDEPPRERTSSTSYDYREKRDSDDRGEERPEKRSRTADDAMEVDKRPPTGRAETPEEGEI